MSVASYKAAVEAAIGQWFAEQAPAAPTAEARLLLSRLDALIRRGGKRARPELLYLTYAAYGGPQPDSLVDLGMALEFHHQFLLVHDDVIDADTVRYNGPNIMGYYQQDTLHSIGTDGAYNLSN